MEIVLATPALDRGHELVMNLALKDIAVRALSSTGSEMVGHVARSPVDGVILLEQLPDGPADVHLRSLMALPGQRPVAIVLVYRSEGKEQLRERVRSTYGMAAEIVLVGTRPMAEVAAEVAGLLDRIKKLIAEQEQDAHQRLSVPTSSTAIPQPVRRQGLVGFLGASGGVGTSTLVANLGAAAAMAGQRVLLVDAQFQGGPSLLHHLGYPGADDLELPTAGLLSHDYEAFQGAVAGGALGRVKESCVMVQMLKVHHPPITVLQVPLDVPNRNIFRAELMLWAIRVLLESREYDAVLVDLGSGLGDPRTVQLLQAASDTFIVTENRATAVNSLFKLVASLPLLNLSADPYLVIRYHEDSAFTDKLIHNMTRRIVTTVLPEAAALIKREGRQFSDSPPLAVTEVDSGYTKAVQSLGIHLGLINALGGQQAPPEPVKQTRSRGFFGFGGR